MIYKFFIRVLIAILLIFYLSGFSPAQNNSAIESKKNTVILEGLKLVYDAKYNEAIRHFHTLDHIDPDCSEGLFFEAFVLELVMDIYRSQVFDDSLNRVVDRAVAKGNEAIKKNPTARNYMFLGGEYGIRGFRRGILGSWFGAYIDGLRTISQFNKVMSLDSTLYDCYYGIGSYHYWKTKKLKQFFGFLVPDEREQGIRELSLAMDKGIFAKTPGRMALFRIYMEEKRYDDVFKLTDIVLKENPNHIFPRWYAGVAYIRTKQWEKALQNYEVILNYLPRISFCGIEAYIEAWYYMGLCYYNLGNDAKVKELLSPIPQYKDKVNNNLFYYDDCMEESIKLLKVIG